MRDLIPSRVSANFILVVAGLEFLPHVPDYAYRYASFLFSFVGRGVCKISSLRTSLYQMHWLIVHICSLHLHWFYPAPRQCAAHH
jgi:hypothetical protein